MLVKVNFIKVDKHYQDNDTTIRRLTEETGKENHFQ